MELFRPVCFCTQTAGGVHSVFGPACCTFVSAHGHGILTYAICRERGRVRDRESNSGRSVTILFYLPVKEAKKICSDTIFFFHCLIGNTNCIVSWRENQSCCQSSYTDAENSSNQNKCRRNLFHWFFLLADGVKHLLALSLIPYEPGKVLVNELLKFMILHCNTTPLAFPAEYRWLCSIVIGLSRRIIAVHLRPLLASALHSTAAEQPHGILRGGA